MVINQKITRESNEKSGGKSNILDKYSHINQMRPCPCYY